MSNPENRPQGKIPSPELLELLREPLNAGCEIRLSVHENHIRADMDTQGKSSCILEDTPEGIFAHRRYDRKDKVNSPEELRKLVHDCCHGRQFFSEKWLTLFETHGMNDPRGTL